MRTWNAIKLKGEKYKEIQQNTAKYSKIQRNTNTKGGGGEEEEAGMQSKERKPRQCQKLPSSLLLQPFLLRTHIVSHLSHNKITFSHFIKGRFKGTWKWWRIWKFWWIWWWKWPENIQISWILILLILLLIVIHIARLSFSQIKSWVALSSLVCMYVLHQ